jgi:hypothetical protein
VCRWCRKQGLQDADADVSLRALLQAVPWLHTFEYQPQRARFRDWLSTVIRRCLFRFRECQGREVAVGGNEAVEAALRLPPHGGQTRD